MILLVVVRFPTTRILKLQKICSWQAELPRQTKGDLDPADSLTCDLAAPSDFRICGISLVVDVGLGKHIYLGTFA